jgi:hypothetical protein
MKDESSASVAIRSSREDTGTWPLLYELFNPEVVAAGSVEIIGMNGTLFLVSTYRIRLEAG